MFEDEVSSLAVGFDSEAWGGGRRGPARGPHPSFGRIRGALYPTWPQGPMRVHALPSYCSTKAPSAANNLLDTEYGALQDVAGDRHPRTSSHLLERGAAHKGAGALLAKQPVSKHLSIMRLPLLKEDPKQVVPIPLHLTLGVNTRLLRLCEEVIIMYLSA